MISAEQRAAALLSSRTLLGAGLAYLFAMGLVGVLVLKNASIDAAEQLLWTQSLQAGYGIQPPLYTWLQHGALPSRLKPW